MEVVHFDEPRPGCFGPLRDAVARELGLFTHMHQRDAEESFRAAGSDTSPGDQPSSVARSGSSSGASTSQSGSQEGEATYPSWLHSRIKCVMPTMGTYWLDDSLTNIAGLMMRFFIR